MLTIKEQKELLQRNEELLQDLIDSKKRLENVIQEKIDLLGKLQDYEILNLVIRNFPTLFEESRKNKYPNVEKLTNEQLEVIVNLLKVK